MTSMSMNGEVRRHRNPKVTAIVVNRNGKQLLPNALLSLQEQDYEPLEIVVVDNASSDGSQQLVKGSFGRAALIENEKNEGFGGANNQGIAYALADGADYVFLFNNDAVAARNCVSVLVDSARSHNVDMTGPKIFYEGEDQLIWSAGGVIDFWRGRVAHIGIRERDEGQYKEAVLVDYLTACAVLISARLLEEVGSFDPAFHPAYGEDTDLCLRARNAGFRLLFEPKAEVWHRISASSGGGVTALKVRLRLQHEMLLFWRYAQWYHWITIPPFVSARAVGYLVRWTVQGKWDLIEAVGQGVGGLIRAIRKGKQDEANEGPPTTDP